MLEKIKISVEVPSSNNVSRHISLSLKKRLSNEPAEYPEPAKILVLSNFEGDFLALRRFLLKNRVIDNKYQWTFDNGHLVILGQALGHSKQMIECLWLIYALENKARAGGGYVHYILGHHEILNMNGDWRHLHPRYAVRRSSAEKNIALYDANSELWRWLQTKNIMEKIGSLLFVAAGISHELLAFNMTLPEINLRVRPFYTVSNTEFRDPLLRCVFDSDCSPLRYPGYFAGGDHGSLIESTLAHFAVNTIVTGYTVAEPISLYFNGKVINVSSYYSTECLAALFIRKQSYYKFYSHGNREKIK